MGGGGVSDKMVFCQDLSLGVNFCQMAVVFCFCFVLSLLCGVVVSQTHTNPCFLRQKGKGVQEVLQRDLRQCLVEGDVFGLLPDQLFYTVTYGDVPVNGVKRWAQYLPSTPLPLPPTPSPLPLPQLRGWGGGGNDSMRVREVIQTILYFSFVSLSMSFTFAL